MSSEELAAIRVRLAEATPGPWRYSCCYGVATVESMTGESIADLVEYTVPDNADFIAHSPTDIAALLAEVERLQMLNMQLTALAKKCGYDVISVQELFGADIKAKTSCLDGGVHRVPMRQDVPRNCELCGERLPGC